MAAITVIGAQLSQVITTVLRLYYGLDTLLVMEGSWFTATDRFVVLGHGAYQPLTWVVRQRFHELTSRLCRSKNIALENSRHCAIRRETGYILVDGRIVFYELDLPYTIKNQSKSLKLQGETVARLARPRGFKQPIMCPTQSCINVLVTCIIVGIATPR